MGWQRGEEKGAQEGRKLRRNIYADFISVWVPALESGKLMTLIPKLVCLELCTRPAPSPSGRAAQGSGPSPSSAGWSLGLEWQRARGRKGGEEAEGGGGPPDVTAPT